MTVTERPTIKMFQGFTEADAAEDKGLYPIVIGPLRNAITYADDKTASYANVYDKDVVNTLSYPGKNNGTISDFSKVAVYFDEAELEYLQKDEDSGNYEFRIISNFKNKIRTVADVDTNNLVFKSYTSPTGIEYPRSSIFERDINVNDIIEITNGTNIFKTQILSILHEEEDSVIGSLSTSSLNKSTQAHSIGNPVITVVAGDDTLASAGTYLGDLSSNVLEDVYSFTVLSSGGAPTFVITPAGGNSGDDDVTIDTAIFDHSIVTSYEIEVSTGGIPGVAAVVVTDITNSVVMSEQTVAGFGSTFPLNLNDKGTIFSFDTGGTGTLVLGDVIGVGATPSAATIQISSESGIDNEAVRRFPGFESHFTAGSLGLTISITDGGDTVLTQGLSFIVSVVKAITAIVPVVSGVYSGTKDMVYYFEVIDGGPWGEATFKTTSSSTDASGPTIASAADTAILAGSFGLYLTFPTNTQGGLVLGDTFSVPVTAIQDGAFKTLVTKKNIAQLVLDAETPSMGVLTPGGTNSGASVLVLGGTYAEVGNALSTVKTEIYTFEITKVGATNVAEMTITSASGKDDGEAFVITDNTGAVEFDVNLSGLTINIADADDSFDLGDTWTVEITKQNLGISMRLVKSNAKVDSYKDDLPGQYAWEASADTVDVYQDIKLFDSSWNAGTESLKVIYAKVYIEYLAFYGSSLGVKKVSSSASKEDLETELMNVAPDGVLGYGVYMCVSNCPNIDTKYLALETDDTAGWEKAIKILKKDPNVYSLVPATDRQDIIELFKTHLEEMNDALSKRWRRMYCSITPPDQVDVYVNYTDAYGTERDLTAVSIANPNESKTVYNYIEISEDQDVELIQDGVTANTHVLKFKFETDENGEIVFEEYDITEIYSDSSFKISPALVTPISSASKYEIYKKYSNDDKSAYFSTFAKKLKSRKICLIFPWEYIDNDGQTASSIHLASAIAGLKSSVDPHQGITNFELQNVDSVELTYVTFSEDEMQDLADDGVLSVIQETAEDVPFIRHQLTTNVDREEWAELSVDVTYDSISYYMSGQLAEFPGRWNMYDAAYDAVRAKLLAGIETKKISVSEQIGSPIISGTVDSITKSLTQKTKLEIAITYEIVGPMNVLSVQQTMYI